MKSTGPVDTDIVLIGGGHAHVHVLAAFAMRPQPGVRVTLVARDLETPYSGMLPGLIAGLYAHERAHIDLVKLAAATGTRLIHAEAVGLDRVSRRVLLNDRAPIGYDLVSVDVGITPELGAIAGAVQHAIAVKPIGSFISKFNKLRELAGKACGSRRIVVIGGGAGGVELLLSLRARLLADAQAAGHGISDFRFALVTEGEILRSHNARVRMAFRRILGERAVVLHENSRAVRIDEKSVELADGRKIAADCALVTTQAAAPGWFAGTGLALDENGFLAVGATFQSPTDPAVFAAGDCAALVASAREKAGVYAVRAGPPLAENLRRYARGASLKAWRPQSRHLALISTGERYAVASRGILKAEGAWLWTLKDWIDRRWMRKYQDVERLLARMAERTAAPPTVKEEGVDIRCGGCAAKVGPAPLSRALARFEPSAPGDIVVGLDAPDDAAILVAPKARHLVQTVDFFRAFIDDAFVFGEVAASHALNDIFAMGGRPRWALATVVIPHGPSAKVEEELFQVLAGLRFCLDREQVALAGGHSGEGAELAVGLAVTGDVAPDKVLRKGGLRQGNVLILTRPLGTGILFAAAMRAKASAPDIAQALALMRQSNRAAAAILIEHGATAMTDVTGFGLIGHLGEMMAASGAQATLDLAAVPVYGGVVPLVRAGISSTLLPENLALAGLLDGDVDQNARAVLFDPQTAGGLLAGIPAARARSCLTRLRAAGYDFAAAIGTVSATKRAPRDVRIRVEGRLPD